MTSNTKKIIRLKSQKQRTAFARRELRSQGLTVKDVADETGHCWGTINNFMQDRTKDPRTNTTVNIFHALGYDVVLTQSKRSRGQVQIG